ncbi:MAG: ZIP family magnesium transporter [Candidatus Latescibacteria bacterium]|nr:ZIP family magnesium transporter [Candidatus Latescibacterota bacterium]
MMAALAILFGVLCLGANVLGGAIALRASRSRKGMAYAVAAGAGFMLAVALLEMLPQGLARTPHAPLLALVGYGLIHLCEHVFTPHFHFGEEVHAEAVIGTTASMAALAGLMAHSFVDGLSVAGGVASGPLLGMMVFLGVALHSIPAGFTMGSMMLAAGQPGRTAILSSLLIGGATVIGACSIFVIGTGDTAGVGMVLSLSAGSFIYIAATDLIPLVNTLEGRHTTWAILGGVGLFYGMSQALEAFK